MDWLCCTITRSMKEFRQKKRQEWVEELNGWLDVPECDISLWFCSIHSLSLGQDGVLYICTSIFLSASAFHSSTPIVKWQKWSRPKQSVKAKNYTDFLWNLLKNPAVYMLTRSKVRFSIKVSKSCFKHERQNQLYSAVLWNHMQQLTIQSQATGLVRPDLLFSGNRPTSLSSSLTWLFLLLP